MPYWIAAGLVPLAAWFFYLRRWRIHLAARSGHAGRLGKLLDRNPAGVHTINRVGNTPLHEAAMAGRVDCMRVCLDHGADVNAVTFEGVTPLHFAATIGSVDAVSLLLHRRAAPDLHEKEGMTPIMAAIVRGHDEVGRLLRAAGAQDFLILPPLAIDHDDPFMLEARGKARDTCQTFLQLASERPESACVKVPYQTDSGEIEHIWCDWLSLDSDHMRVRIRTYPINQRARISLEQRFPINQLEDWQIENADGSVRGGYTFRVMFQFYREKLGELPPELAEQEKRYVDG